MNYIIVDFEWNQPASEATTITEPIRFDSEIIEIGAVKVNENFDRINEFSTYIRPSFYPVMHGGVARLTKIRTQDLANALSFPAAYRQFSNWCGEDYCLCTWGTNDVPVLLDNMLMHGLETPNSVFWCDLQKIFGAEMMRDEKKWSLEKAVDLLGLAKERAHDALNDARNTCSICERLDIASYVDEYVCNYVNYASDRLNGFISGKAFMSIEAAQSDEAFSSMVCPYCGEKIQLGVWIRFSKHASLSYAQCSQGDEFLARFHSRSSSSDLLVARSILGMSDVLWDDYQDALERSESYACCA